MKRKKIQIFQKIKFKFYFFASIFAVTISTLAVNNRCWYIMYEEMLPEDLDMLKKI